MDPQKIEWQDLDPHQSDKMDPDPHQSDKMDPDPHQFADDKPKCTVCNVSLFEHRTYIWKLGSGS